MAHRLLSKVFWSIQLICLVLAGGGTVQGLEVPQGDSQALVHGPRRSRSLYNKHPYSSLVLPQGADSSEHSDLSSWTRNGYDSDEPTLRRLASSDPFMPSSSNVNLFQSNSLLGAKGVPSGSTTDTMGFQRRVPNTQSTWSSVKTNSVQDAASLTNLQDAVHPFYQGYGQNIGFPAMYSPQGSGFAQSPYASLQKFRPYGVFAPSQLQVPQVSSLPAQMLSSQVEYLYSDASSAPGNMGIAPPVASCGGASSQPTSFASVPQVGSSAQVSSSPYSFTAPAQTAYVSSSFLSEPSSSQVAHDWHLSVPSQAGASPGVSSSVQGSYGMQPVDTQGDAGSGLGCVVAPHVGSMAGQPAVPHVGFTSVGFYQPLPGSGLASSQSSYNNFHVGSGVQTAPVPPTEAQVASAPGFSWHTTGHSGPQFPGFTESQRGSAPGHTVGAVYPEMVQLPTQTHQPHGMDSPVTSGFDLGSSMGYFGTYRPAWGPNQPVLSSHRVPGELCFCLKDFGLY